MYKHGDIVKPISIEANFEYHIVTDCETYRNPFTKKLSTRYQIMQIYPVKKSSEVNFCDKIDLFLVSKCGSHKAKHIMELVKKERQILGFTERADYFRTMEVNIHSENSSFEPFVDESEAELGVFLTLDEGLEAIHDLQNLYEIIGDKAYLEEKEKVIERIKEIIKEDKRKSKGKIHK